MRTLAYFFCVLFFSGCMLNYHTGIQKLNENQFKAKIYNSLNLEDHNSFNFGFYNIPNKFETNDKLLEHISQKILIEVSKKLG